MEFTDLNGFSLTTLVWKQAIGLMTVSDTETMPTMPIGYKSQIIWIECTHCVLDRHSGTMHAQFKRKGKNFINFCFRLDLQLRGPILRVLRWAITDTFCPTYFFHQTQSIRSLEGWFWMRCVQFDAQGAVLWSSIGASPNWIDRPKRMFSKQILQASTSFTSFWVLARGKIK